MGGGVRILASGFTTDYDADRVKWTIVDDRVLGLVLPGHDKPIADPFREGPLSDDQVRRVREGRFADW